MLPRTTQQSYSAALGRESQIEPWLAFANTLLAGAKSSHGTTQPKMLPQPIHAPAPSLAAAQRGWMSEKKPPSKKEGEVFFLDIPFYRTLCFVCAREIKSLGHAI